MLNGVGGFRVLLALYLQNAIFGQTGDTRW